MGIFTKRRLTDAQEDAIFDEYSSDRSSQRQLADLYGVSRRTISRAIQRAEDRVLEEQGIEEDFVEDNNDRLMEVTIEFDDDFEEDIAFDEPDNEVEYTFIATNQSISITRILLDIDGFSVSDESETIDDSHENFKTVFNLIWSTQGSQEALEEAFSLMSKARQIEAYSQGRIKVDPLNEKAVYVRDNGTEKELPPALQDRLIDAVTKKSGSLEGLCHFSERLLQNPSNKSVNGLYRFLVAKNIEIDNTGMVVCFKKIKSDYTDCYTGKIDNSVGGTVSVDRNEVDEDSSQTCSYGLHVCSASYLGSYHGERVVRCLVDPADFVAVPPDYSDAKARVCKYIVMDEVTDKFKRGELNG